MIPAFVFARGGSKRISRKNVLPICGRPVVEWSIIQAQSSHMITDVFLTTDDDEIAAIGVQAGIDPGHMIRRLPWDFGRITGSLVMADALDAAYRMGYDIMSCDPVVSIAGCCILRPPGQLDKQIKKYLSGKHVSVHVMMPWAEPWAVEKLPDGYVKTIIGKFEPKSGWNPDSDEQYMRPFGGQGVADVRAHLGLIEINFQHFAWVRGEQWQCFDLDEPDDIPIVEGMFQTQIIDKLGRDCYAEYAARRSN